jgi:hypothetical protein
MTNQRPDAGRLPCCPSWPFWAVFYRFMSGKGVMDVVAAALVSRMERTYRYGD